MDASTSSVISFNDVEVKYSDHSCTSNIDSQYYRLSVVLFSRIGIICVDGEFAIQLREKLMSIEEVNALYRERNLVERCFNRLKQYRRIATRYEKMSENYFTILTLASSIMWS